MVAVFEGNGPVQTRPYGYGNNYLEIIQGGVGGDSAWTGLCSPLIKGGWGDSLKSSPKTVTLFILKRLNIK